MSDDPAPTPDENPPSTLNDDLEPGPDADATGGPTAPDELAERLDPLGVVVGSVVGLAGLLFLAQPYLGRVPVGDARIPAFVLAAGVLGAGFAVGGVGFWFRGRSRIAVGHGVGAAAWLALFAGASVGSGRLVVAGVVLVVAGALFLADSARRRR